MCGTNIPDTTGHQMTASSHLTQHLFLHYLQKDRTSEMCLEMNKKRQ